VTQCIAIRNPTNVNVKKDFKGIRKVFFLKRIKTNRNPAAKSMRYQTIASAVMVIKAPKTAVNPQIKTIR
jgi:hypothetical protein